MGHECVISQSEVIGLLGMSGLSAETTDIAFVVVLYELEKQFQKKTSSIFKWTDSRVREIGFGSNRAEFYAVAINKKIVDVKLGGSIVMRSNYTSACHEVEKEIREFFKLIPLDDVIGHMKFRMMLRQERELNAWLAGLNSTRRTSKD